jgi:hypothetical protein
VLCRGFESSGTIEKVVILSLLNGDEDVLDLQNEDTGEEDSLHSDVCYLDLLLIGVHTEFEGSCWHKMVFGDDVSLILEELQRNNPYMFLH